MENITPSNTPKPLKLLDQLREQIRLRHYSIRTEAQYVQWESFPTWYESERGYEFPRRDESERG